MTKITKGQVIKSLMFAMIGALPGGIWYFNAGTTQSVVIACLGTLIGFGLSLPGVSAARVLAGTAGAIVANNVPRSMQGKVFDSFVGENSNSREGAEKTLDGLAKPQSKNP